ncbi:MAG: hypothetical protein IH796_00700 [Deltaproteobacteria bacterium]|nr:hypothetical protein [Deltaproteobacteria bacterium]
MSGVLGIEMGAEHLRLVHGSNAGGVLRLHDFESEESLTANPENLAQQLEVLVARKGYRSWPVAISLSGPGVVHRLLDFPFMPLNELAVVVQREMRSFEGGEEVTIDWEVTDEVVSGDLKQFRVLVAMAPRSQVDEARQLLDRCHLKPALITTAPTSLLRALKLVEGGETGLRVFLFLGSQEGYLLGAMDGVWSFYREFSSGGSEGGIHSFVGEAMKEAHRALLYHRQHFADGGGLNFLLAGERGLEELKARLRNEMDSEGEIVRPGPSLDLTPLKERAQFFQAEFPRFIIPLGLVAATHVKRGINLIPETARASVRNWPTVNLSFLYQPVSMMMILLILAAFHFYLVRAERHYRDLLSERKVLYAQWLPAIELAKKSRALHENQRLLNESLSVNQIYEPPPPWVTLFKTLSRLAPPDLIFTTLSMGRDNGKWQINLKGEVVSSGAYDAQLAFSDFYRSLKGSLRLEEIELLPLKMSTIKETGQVSGETELAVPPGGEVSPVGQGTEIEKTKIQFEVRGQVRFL